MIQVACGQICPPATALEKSVYNVAVQRRSYLITFVRGFRDAGQFQSDQVALIRRVDDHLVIVADRIATRDLKEARSAASPIR
ncbi:MAG: hypothetical protein JWM11_7845 [Planctomycetaceae bacterium]|nr:hypothetical protein [Planctomycetaceae bacterium]